MGMQILYGIVANFLYDLLKRPVPELLKQTSLQKAISETASMFGDIEGVADHLENWVKRDEARQAIIDFLDGHPEEIDPDELSNVLVEKVGFYYGEESHEKAAEIIQTFLQCLLNKILTSEHGLLVIYKQIEEVRRKAESIGAYVVRLPDIEEAIKRLETSIPFRVLMSEADWAKLPEADRKLLEERAVEPLLVKDSEDIPQLMGQLAGEAIHFSISFASEEHDQWRVITDGKAERVVDVPWKGNRDFGIALMEFTRMTDKRAVDEKGRAELHLCAVRIGDALGKALLTDGDSQRINNASGQGNPPLVTVESDDDLILSLPWELLRIAGEFAVREARIDLVRSAPARSKDAAALSPPDGYLRLVVNVSAPEGQSLGHLNYEAESYRIIRALHDYSDTKFTELGSLDDMVKAVEEHNPAGVHFSGHGGPGTLLFEDDEGMENPVTAGELLAEFRTKGIKLPPFFYLASCHGNTPAKPEAGEAGSGISAAQLHREGVVQVVGYYGPIIDELSTMAEEAVYRSLAASQTTRYAIRQARRVLAKGQAAQGKGIHRDMTAKEMVDMHPFAWAQLVFYHRGPDYPLSLKIPPKYAQDQEAKLEREFTGTDQRRILSTGFIGRRRELYAFRRAVRKGQHVFVFQGLGGLGKSTLAFRTLPMLAKGCPTLTIWCQEVEAADNQAQELASRLSQFGQSLSGLQWVNVVSAVDRSPDVTEAQRFGFFLQTIVGNVGRMVIYLDNMESLLTGPDDEDPKAFGSWRSPEAAQIWDMLKEMSGDKLAVMASCRYRNPALDDAAIHVPEMTDDAIFRMMGWFDGLRRLSIRSRGRLLARLHGHPRAVEFLADLINAAIREWEDRRGEWKTPTTDDDIEREWEELIEPALPEVEERLRQNLLLDAIWRNVLDDRCRRMLFRMTLLRRPWDWDLMMQLGEADEENTEETVQKLRGTSLLGQVQERGEEGWKQLLQVHPATARFIAGQFDEPEELRQETYRRVGTYLEKLAETSTDIRVLMDAGHYLFQCGEFDRAYEILGSTSDTLQEWGMVRAGIAVLEPFERAEVMEQMNPELRRRMLGTAGSAYHRLGQVEKAVEYYEKALKISRETGDRMGEGIQLGNLGVAYAALGQVEKAIEHYQQALEIARETGDRGMEGNALGNLGNAYADLGQVEKAIEHYQQALEIARKTGDRMGEGSDIGNLGAAYADPGQVEKAIEYHQQALEISRETGDRRAEGSDLGNLGLAYADLGQVEKAIEYHQQALEIARETGDRRGEGSDLGNLGLAYARLGQVEKAREYLEATLAIAREIKDPRMEAIVLRNLEKLKDLHV